MNFQSLTAEDLMSRSVATTRTDQTLHAAAIRMSDAKVHCLIVEDARNGDPIGVITTKDLTQPMFLESPELLDEMLVEDVMTRPPVSVRSKMTVLDCVRLMRMAGVRSAPVFEGDRLVGVMSFTDVLRMVAQKGQTPVAATP